MSEEEKYQPSLSTLELINNLNTNDMRNELTAINHFQAMVQEQLTENQDYGIIQGTNKPTLLKPGAEKILMIMGVQSKYEIVDKIEDYQKGYFDYTVQAKLLKNGMLLTEGLGSANTNEKKFQRKIKNSSGEKEVDPNSGFDMKNTVLKMAKKRAQIDATLTIASLSNIFTQDLDELKDFSDREKSETMTIEIAENTKITFGKHKGETLSQVMKSDQSYIRWLSDNARQADLKQASKMLLNPPADENGEKLATKDQVIELSDLGKTYAESHGIVDAKKTTIDLIKMADSDWLGDLTKISDSTYRQAKKYIQDLMASEHVPSDPFAGDTDTIEIDEQD
ncbi:exodeoxyribonuclease X C-terminal domain-containing protein [Lentilactobacillus kosonis]|uniref:Exodeoxyribonuclease X-like C-terminal domain-containing protein n=1 Tax=Lentilactobacillus kosonis TaxID=2810561 RepID=A0A401FPW0_9LACO|nr:hypothetical protein [Lentilactobacillus kosonis]GAY74241.1 hypothetical protein NBRC111893_2387 [Lentilactobacillus kosonis]